MHHITVQFTRMSIRDFTAFVAKCVPEEEQERAEMAGNTVQFDSDRPLDEIVGGIGALSDSISKIIIARG